jgi:hypothetical protein
VYAHRCTHGGPPRPHLIVQCADEDDADKNAYDDNAGNDDDEGSLLPPTPIDVRSPADDDASDDEDPVHRANKFP